MALAITSAFSFPLPGKPNPYESWDPQVGDHRPRVLQKGQKGHDCFYTVCNMLRQRIGKNPPPGFEKARDIEARLSKWRKQQNENRNSSECEMTIVRGWRYRDLPISQQKQLLQTYYNRDTIDAIGIKLRPEERQKISDFITSFVHENKEEQDLLSFANNRSALRRVTDAKSLLLDFSNGGAVDEIEKIMQSEGIEAAAKRGFGLVHLSMVDRYNLSQSHWHPLHSIQSLMQEIEQHGPHMVAGHFGANYYEEPPVQLQDTIEDRPVFGWEPGMFKGNVDNGDTHAILIIGARVIDGVGYVYFVDPNNPSDPADLTKQKVYVIPYKTLRENICTTDGRFGKAPNGARAYIKPRQQGGNCYAVHGEKPPSLPIRAPQEEKA